jgi:hypothetical protein
VKVLACLGLIALLPAALNAAPTRAQTMVVPLCTSDGQLRTVEIPLPDPGSERAPCCVKGCHGGSSRKKPARNFEPSQ